MMKFTHTTIVALILTANSVVASTAGVDVVYGEDNRLDLWEVNNPLHLRLSMATAGMVPQNFLSKNENGTYKLVPPTNLEHGLNICADEKFANQPLLAVCSGFLINEDTLVTAGHCVGTKPEEQAQRCADTSWVFGLAMDRPDHIELENISEQNVYKCQQVVKAEFNEREDFAIIKLDRKVADRTPVRYRTSGKVDSKAELVVMGHPSMLPLKIAPAGRVLRNTDHFKFTTSLDTFQGNSGSAVFDAKTGTLEGILVSGKPDYVPRHPNVKDSCQVVNYCDPSGLNCSTEEGSQIEGENVTRITTILEYL